MDRFVIKRKRTNEEISDDGSQKEKYSNVASTISDSDSKPCVKQARFIAVNNSPENQQECVTTPNLTKSKLPKAYERWKTEYPFLDLNKNDLAICNICTEAIEKKLVFSFDSRDSKSKETWVETGFGNWKHGAERIKNHSKSALHLACAEALKKHHSSSANVIQHLSAASAKEMKEHRVALKKIFSTLKTLAKQGLPIRGADNDENSNFLAFLKARAEDVSELESWLKRTGSKWLHHDIQNEILELMANKIISDNITEINDAEFVAILLDGASDISKTEQFSVFLRIVNKDLVATEFFMGFYTTSDEKAETLPNLVRDVFLRFNLPLSKLRGQCYDGAANVAGNISGLQARVKAEEPRALFVHCNAHNLNLVVQDAMEEVAAARKFIGIVKDMINFVRDSPKRVAQFRDLQSIAEADSDYDLPALAAFCMTRWVIRIKSLKTVLANYAILMEFLYNMTVDPSVDSSIASKASGFLERMESFDFLFSLIMMIEIFDRVEVLNRDLQKTELCIVDSYQKVEAVHDYLKTARDSKFESIWRQSTELAVKLEIEGPKLPRKRRIPKRFQTSSNEGHIFVTPEEFHRKTYFEVFDKVTVSLEDRFNTDSANFFKSLENFLIGKPVDTAKIIEFYQGDFDRSRLVDDRDMFLQIMKKSQKNATHLKDVVLFLRENQWCQGLVPEFLRFVRLLMTIPGSSCSNERSFSVMRRLKNYLRSTMLQKRLNHLAILHVYADSIEKLNLDLLMDSFITRNAKRTAVFALQH